MLLHQPHQTTSPRPARSSSNTSPRNTTMPPPKPTSPARSHGALLAHGASIPDSKLAADGRETQPHITVKYGLHGNDPAEVAKVLQNIPPITATLGKTSLFSNDDADVLKVDVDSPDLHRLNKLIAEALPNTDTHPEYQPHATIAYLKPGQGKAYSGQTVPGVTGQQVTLDHITFSGKNGEQVDIPLQGTPAQAPAADLAAPASAENSVAPEAKPLALAADLAAPKSLEKPATIEPERPSEQPATEIQNAVRSSSGEPLAGELPAGSGGARAPGTARTLRGPRSGTGRRRVASGSSQGTGVSPSSGAGEPGVGDTADAHNNNPNFPPRAGTVTSTRFEHDYRIPDGRIISGSPEVRAKANLAAIETLRTLEKENRPATVEEQQVLAGYVGWGAVPQLFSATTPEWQQAQERLKSLISEEEYEQARRSTTNAHYTDDLYVDAIWKALQHLGARAGMSWGEPALGSGTFFGRQPAELLEGARRIGIEKDALTAAIAKYLYPDSGVDHKPFEEAELPENYFDGFVSNVPFGDFGVHDPTWRNRKYLTNPIHNYFFAKSLEYVRPGGVVAFVTSRYTMDGYDKPHQQFRDYIQTKADFLGAVRLPTNAMKAGGTHVITDVIFLRKRLPGAQPLGQPWAQVTRKNLRAEHLGYSMPVSVNEYYSAHPENVLGEERLERGQFTNADYTVRGSVTADSLNAALQSALPRDGFQAYAPGSKSSKVALRDVSNTAEARKLGGLFFDEKGELYRKVSKGSAEPVDGPATVKERIKGQLGIRDILQKLVADEQADRPEGELNQQRAALNKAYDRYVKSYGPLSNRQNMAAMRGDPDSPVLVALERKYDEKARTAEKAAIFGKRAFPAIKKSESAADAKEALYIALNEKGHIDWNRMQELTGKVPEEMQGDLKGVVYQDPRTNEWELAEEYLSGAVRSKLKEAQKFAKLDPKFHENVEALQQVLPDDIPPSQISALPGVTWVPAEIYSQFAKDVLNSDEAPQVRYVGGEWHVDQAWGGASKWSTADVDAYSILKDTLNLRRVKVHDRDGKLDKQATLAARDKQKQLAEHFEKWLFADADRANQVTFLYNDLINDLRLRTYDGSHLTVPEMSRAVLRSGDLEPYQKAAVWRQIAQRNVLLAHAVGSGKTFEMITGAMELQRLGLIKRPMFVVPNSTLGGWQQQFAMLYPQKRVLVFSEKDLERKNRQRIFAQIQLGDWDAVIVPHSSFQFIPVGDDLFQEHFARKAQELAEAIKDAAEAGTDTRLIKRLEKAKEKLLTQMQERRNNARQDLTVSWEQMGIDQLYVDEAHEYKKLGFSTKQQNVAGIDPNGNQKTFDLKMKVDWTQRHGRGVTFATGTPVTNTMGELYNVMQYLIPQELASRGLGRFDEWSANFGRTKDVFEPKPEGGGYQVKPRYAEFVNLQDLGQLFRSFADVLTSDMLDIPRPEFAGGQRRSIVSELTDAQKDIMQDLQSRAAGMRADPHGALPDNMAALYTDAQLMALDARMLDPDAPDEPDNRLNQAANEIHRMWQESAGTKGTQLVFADYGKPASERAKTGRRKREDDELGPAMPVRKARTFSAYDELIKKLQQRGIPANEIAHIYMAKNKAQRAKLFQDVNDGRVRVLIGSIAKMGTGVNVQQRGYGMHFLTLPHRPADLEQAEGRFKRQGNIHKEVHSVYYITKGSLDELKFSGVSRKLKAFNQFMQGKSTLRKMEDVDDMAPSLDQFTAQASGDPRVKRKLEVDNELIRLSELHSAYRDEQWSNQRKLNEIPQRIARAERTIGQYQSDIATRDTTGRVWTIGKKKMSGEGLQKAAGEAIEQILKSAQGNQKIGTAYGLPLTWNGLGSILVDGHPLSIGQTEISDGQGFVHYVPNGVGTFTRIENYIKHIEGHVTSQEDVVASAEKDRIALREALEQAWPYKDEYGKLQKEQSELFTALGGNKNDQAADMMDDGEDLADESVEAAEPEDSEDDGEETAKPKPQSGTGSVTLGSGFGALQPGYEIAEAAARQFVREEVVPKVASMLQGARDLNDTMVRWIDPRRGVPIGTLDAIYRMKGGRDAADYLLSQQLDKWGDRVNRMSQDEMVNFIDRMKAGRPQIDPELQKLAAFLRKMDDELFAEVERYKPSIDYLENHFRVLWKVIPGSPEAKGDLKTLFQRAFGSRRPLEGGRSFLKQHKLADMTEGLEKGGVPYVYSPIEMFKAHYSDAMKFITAQRLWEQFEKMGVRKFVRLGKQGPEGFEPLDDRIARVYFPVKEGMVHAGEWWVEEGSHRLLKNFLSRDLIREHAFGRALMDIKNGTTAIELGISPFHAVFEGNEAVGSQIGIGLRQIWNLGVRKGNVRAIGQGVRSIVTAPEAAVTAAQLGARAKEAFGNFDEFSKTPVGRAFLKDNPTVQQDVMDLFHGGIKLGMHEDYKINAARNFQEYLSSAGSDNPGHYISAAVRSVPALNQWLMKPLFEHYIPNLKLGFALKEYNLAKAEYSDRLASGEMTREQLARQIVDSVENRFGEMNFDNLFWNRTFKTWAQLLFRSVTWKLGNLRANVGALTGEWAEMARAFQKRELPMLHPNTAWLLGMTLWTCVLGATIHTLAGLFARKSLQDSLPRHFKDFVFPYIDAAAGIRIALPTYWRDIVHLLHSPVGYVQSSLSGEIGRIADLWENKDFYGNEIWNADDPLPQKVLEGIRHLLPLPFSISSARQARQQGGSEAARVAGYLGFTKAPRYIEQTDAEQLASEYAAQHRETGARTSKQAEAAQAISGIRNLYRRGVNPQQEIQDAIQKGLIAARDVPKIRVQARRPPLASAIGRLSMPEALNVYNVATPDERKQITMMVRKKVFAARLQPKEWTPTAQQLASKYFGVRPVMPRPAFSDFGVPAAIQ